MSAHADSEWGGARRWFGSRLPLFALAALLVACHLPRGRLFDGFVERTEVVMGTRLRLAFEAAPGRAADPIFADAFARARALDDLLSDYREETPLSRLSAAAGGEPVQVVPALRAFLERARRDHQATDGAFDVTIGALVRAGRSRDAGAIAKARELIGFDLVELLGDGRARLRHAGVRLDAGGIGKGMAVDAMVEVLRAAGVRRAFIDFGGSSFYGLGAPRGRRGWPVLIAGHGRAQPLGVVSLRDEGFSSSEALVASRPGGRRRRHIVDPRTRTIVAVERYAAALSPSATDADVLTTALIVDPSLRPKLAARYPGAAVLVVDGARAPDADPALSARMSAP